MKHFDGLARGMIKIKQEKVDTFRKNKRLSLGKDSESPSFN
jgi:hypothetical protein